MSKRLIVTSLALCWLGCVTCSNKGIIDAPTVATPTPEPKIVYGQGVFDQERGPGDTTWRPGRKP